MRQILIYMILLLATLTACVTERVEPDDNGVAFLEQEIDRIVKRLPYQTGMDHYTDLNHLVAFGTFAIEPMMKCLDDPNIKVRASAALVLGQLRAKEALDKLLEMENDESDWVRLEAARAVLEIGAWDTIPMLLDGLSDPGPETRWLCFDVLSRKTGESFGYDPDAGQEERDASVMLWKSWWEQVAQLDSTKGNLVSH